MLLERKVAVVYGAGSIRGSDRMLDDVGAVAVFVASERAWTMTAATVNVGAGALIDD